MTAFPALKILLLNNDMKTRILILLVLVCGYSFASTSLTSEGRIARALETTLWEYERFVSKQPVENWDQIRQVDKGLYGLNSFLKKGSVENYFIFVPLLERARFPDGDLILVQNTAMEWPDLWRTDDPKNPSKFLSHPSHKQVRYLVYRSGGKFASVYWYEDRFQKMLLDTRMSIPALPRR